MVCVCRVVREDPSDFFRQEEVIDAAFAMGLNFGIVEICSEEDSVIFAQECMPAIAGFGDGGGEVVKGNSNTGIVGGEGPCEYIYIYIYL